MTLGRLEDIVSNIEKAIDSKNARDVKDLLNEITFYTLSQQDVTGPRPGGSYPFNRWLMNIKTRLPKVSVKVDEVMGGIIDDLEGADRKVQKLKKGGSSRNALISRR